MFHLILELKVLVDNTKFIKQSIKEVEETLGHIIYTGSNYYLPFLPRLADRLPPVN
jgi:hypothetical protein